MSSESRQQSTSPPPSGSDSLPTLEGYDLIEAVGRGGMGVVYEAYQQSTGRRVAIKVMLDAALDSGRSSPAARRRFEREVELIARLQHPNIVSIIDSGVQRGRYFYVMAFVDGQPLDMWHGVSTRESQAAPDEKQRHLDHRPALELMIKICRAVDYAHQRGVLHRDLKPSNILIDKNGDPHVLDFGLGKSFDADDAAIGRISLSESGQPLGTLAYMSPEQSRGDILQTSVRSDVYSLGAIAYELISGKLPCSLDGPLAEILLRISSVHPAPPSSITARRDPDLDAILLKALEKDAQARYATAGELALDIGRYLKREPVTARHIGPLIRLGRWVQRRRAVAGVVGLATMLILVIAITSIVQITSERNKFRNMYSVLKNMMESIDPDELNSSNLTAWNVLDQFAGQVEKARMENVPEQEAEIRQMLGITYNKLSRFTDAETQSRRALALRASYLSPPHPDLATSKLWLAAAWWCQGRFADAEPLYREVLSMRNSLHGPASLEVAEAQHHLAACLDSLGRAQEAEQLFRASLKTRSDTLKDPLHKDIIPMHGFLGKCLQHQRKYAESQKELELCLDLTVRKWGAKHWRTARTLGSLASFWRDKGDLDQAEKFAKQSLDMKIEVLGKDNPDISKARQVLDEIIAQRKAAAISPAPGRPGGG